jgi:hypothetical protein
MGLKPRSGRALRFRADLLTDDSSSGRAIALPFDAREVFGRARAPVAVTIGKHTFRSTTASMGGVRFIPINRRNREAAGVTEETRSVDVEIALDTAPRTVTLPRDLADRLDGDLRAAWDRLSYTHQREHVEAIAEAKRPETRARRIERTLEALARR